MHGKIMFYWNWWRFFYNPNCIEMYLNRIACSQIFQFRRRKTIVELISAEDYSVCKYSQLSGFSLKSIPFLINFHPFYNYKTKVRMM